MQRLKWTERIFTFEIPPGWMPNILERLHGTVPRLNDMVAGLLEEDLTSHGENQWSIQEHVGHLLDLEELHEGRIDDFINRKPILRAADMSNAKTNTALHNNKKIASLIGELDTTRCRFIARLLELDDETLNFQSLHPRLKINMRPVDMAFFTAEHDDHHLASIRMMISGIK